MDIEQLEVTDRDLKIRWYAGNSFLRSQIVTFKKQFLARPERHFLAGTHLWQGLSANYESRKEEL